MTSREIREIVEFTGDWSGQVVATSVHAGHELRPEIAEVMVLDEGVRRREEDPHTDRIASVVPARVVTRRSRFEVDLNRPRDEAVYRKPDDCWGLEVWKESPLDAERTAGSLATYDAFYEALAVRLDEVAARGPFVLLDVHSYNHRRDGETAASGPQDENPDVNVGTGTVDRDRFGGVVDALTDFLGSQRVGGELLDVRENVAFEGRAVAWWVHDRYPGVGCVLALEFKKFFMDEWTGVVDEAVIAECGAALAATLPAVGAALEELR